MWENRLQCSRFFCICEVEMKKIYKSICAASLAAVMMLSGCSNEEKTSGDGSSNSQNTDSSRPAKVTEFKLTSSTGAGNSGDVKLEKGDTYAVISVRDYGDIKIKLYPDEAPYAVYNFVEIAKKGDYNGRKFHRLVENFMIQGGSPNGQGGGGSCIDGGSFKNEINTSLRHYYGALCYAASGLGDLSDGFYIVNKKEASDPAANYNNTYSSCAMQAMNYKQQLEALDPSTENYATIKKNGTALYDYTLGSANAIKAMYDTLTDAVTDTYQTKGGVSQLDGMYTVFGQTVEGFEVIDKITAVDKVDDGYGNISKPATDIIIDKVEIFTME